VSRVSVSITTEISLDIETVARWFSGLSDDEMCKFLVIVARETQGWGFGRADMLWYHLGGHLASCECSTPEVREMIRSWCEYMDKAENGP
jgi:hypothetical protein